MLLRYIVTGQETAAALLRAESYPATQPAARASEKSDSTGTVTLNAL